MRGIQNGTTHHIMATGFKHQSLSDPVIFFQKMLPLLTHVLTIQCWSSTRYQPNRISTGMCINTEKSFLHIAHLIAENKRLLSICFLVISPFFTNIIQTGRQAPAYLG
jgi:hypothetical protein